MLNFSLLAPIALGLLALAALIIWLHMIRPARRVVPSMQIWLALPDLPGSAPRRRKLPKLSALLLLQLAALVALVLALAQPFVGPRPPAHLVVVLDASAPMAAKPDGGAMLFDVARNALLADLAARKGAAPERVSLVVAGPEPRLLAARHAYEPQGLLPLLADEAVTGGPADWHATAELVRQTLMPGEDAAGLLVSAFPWSGFPEASTEGLPDFARFAVVSETPILAPALDIDLATATNGNTEIRGVVRGAPDLSHATLEIGFTPQGDIGTRPPLPLKRVTLKFSDGIAEIAEPVDVATPGLLTINVSGEEGLDWPGAHARFLTVPQAPRPILYIAEANASDQPLLRALAAQDGFELFRAEGLPQEHADFALVIVDGVTLPEAPDSPTLWIGDAGTGESESPTVRVADADDWDPLHPLTHGLDWAALRAGFVSTRPLPADAQVLLAGAGYPLLAVGNREKATDIFLRFDQRNLEQNGGTELPILATAITDWLGLTGAPRQNCTVGVPCAAGHGTFVGLDGAGTFTAETNLFTPAVPGLFRATDGRILAVNVAADRFHTAPLTAIDGTDATQSYPLMPWFLAAAILFLAADAALRLHLSGRRALPALVAPLLVVVALIGLAFPLPFARSVAVQLLPEGSPTSQENAVVAGPAPRLAQGIRSDGEVASRITHPQSALRLAAALVPPHQVADIRPQAPLLVMPGAVTLPAHAHLADAPADAIPATSPVLTALALPAHAVEGDRLTLTALVRSSEDMPARVTFFSNGTQLGAEDVALVPGMNRIETDLPPLAAGETQIGVLVTTELDRKSTMTAIVRTREGRPIAILAPEPDHGAAFAELAGASNMVVVDPATAPDYLRNWLDYDAIVLLNMPVRAISSRKAELIKTAVTQHGLGLVMLGGADSFGPGGYFATPFEALSPLSARVPREAPEVTMVFVLDRSGSMNQPVGDATRLEMTRRATLEAIGLLNPESWVGVVAFDSEAHVVLPLTRAGDTETVRAALETVDTGGGTSIEPGLVAGWEMLRGSDAQARHMIVMTDGLSQPGNFGAIAQQMQADGITISAVAVGTGADAYAVRVIAEAGGGALHTSDDFAALPSILSQEAMLFSSPVVEGPAQPRAVDPSDPLVGGLPARLSALDGVVLTTAKPEARLALLTSTADGEETPLLATWRQGNGQVLAFTSDATGPWTRNWQADPGFATLWSHAVNQIRPLRPATGPWLSMSDAGEEIVLTLEAIDAEGAPRTGLAPIVQISPEGGKQAALPMRETLPGIYKAAYTPQRLGRIGASVSLPASPRPGLIINDTTPEEVAEAALYRSRPLWAEPRASAPLQIVGGVEAVPTGWAIRLVPGLSSPWTALALLAFLTALYFYMHPPRRRSASGSTASHTGRPEGVSP